MSRERILDAAVALVDGRGLEALSMRQLGKALGVEAMSLYNHVRNKAQLLDGLYERVLDEMRLPAALGKGWREEARALAQAFRAALARHPALVPLFAARPAVTQASLRHAERALAILARAGFGPHEQLAILQSLVAYVVGAVLSEAAGSSVLAEGTAVDYATLDRAAFPQLAALIPHVSKHRWAGDFDVGLDAFLRGLKPPRRRRPL